MNQRNKRVVAVAIMLVVSMLFGVLASGNSEREYALFGAHSTDKKANIKTLTILYHEYYDLIASFEEQMLDQYDVAMAAHEVREQEVLQQEPEIWETDRMFSERIAAELAEHTEATEMAWENQILALFAIIEAEMDEIEKLADVANEYLTSPKIVTVSDVQYGEYLRNDRLWPVRLVLSDSLLVDIPIDAVVDFAPELMDEERVRRAIIDFDQAVKEQSLKWQLSYYVEFVELDNYSGFLESPEFLVLLDTLTVLDNSGVVLYQRSLQAPAPLAIFTVDRQLELKQITLHPSFSVSDFPSQFSNRYYPRMRDLALPILLTYPEMDITTEDEADRLLAIPDPMVLPVVPKVPPAVEPVVFRIANGAEPESLDPALIQGVPEHRIYEALFEGLVSYDPETSVAIPGVAERWEANADGTQYTFYLRKDALWSDGKPITAHDVVYSWLRTLNPKTGSPYAWFPAMFLVGAEQFNEGLATAEAVGIRALDDYTFQMDLIGPLPYAVDALAHFSFAIVPEHTIEKYGSAWTDVENFVGNGPFILSDRVARTSITATKSDTYWDRDAVSLDTVIFYSSDNPTTNFNMYLNGELDWVTNAPPGADKTRDDFQVSPQLATYYYVFQTEKAPLNNPLVRQALALAVDRKALVDRVLRAGQIPAWGIVPTMAGYDELEFPFDNMDDAIAEAQDLLARAGYPNGAGFPTVPVLYNTDEGHKQIAEFIQQQWKNNLGINVVLENQEWGTYLSNRTTGNFAIARAGWVGDYQDPNTFLDMFITSSGMNGGRYSNEVYDLLIREAAYLEAGADRMGVLNTAERIMINEDQAIMNLYYYVNLNMIDLDKWGGWYPNTMDIHPWKAIYLK